MPLEFTDAEKEFLTDTLRITLTQRILSLDPQAKATKAYERYISKEREIKAKIAKLYLPSLQDYFSSKVEELHESLPAAGAAGTAEHARSVKAHADAALETLMRLNDRLDDALAFRKELGKGRGLLNELQQRDPDGLRFYADLDAEVSEAERRTPEDTTNFVVWEKNLQTHVKKRSAEGKKAAEKAKQDAAREPTEHEKFYRSARKAAGDRVMEALKLPYSSSPAVLPYLEALQRIVSTADQEIPDPAKADTNQLNEAAQRLKEATTAALAQAAAASKEAAAAADRDLQAMANYFQMTAQLQAGITRATTGPGVSQATQEKLMKLSQDASGKLTGTDVLQRGYLEAVMLLQEEMYPLLAQMDTEIKAYENRPAPALVDAAYREADGKLWDLKHAAPEQGAAFETELQRLLQEGKAATDISEQQQVAQEIAALQKVIEADLDEQKRCKAEYTRLSEKLTPVFEELEDVPKAKRSAIADARKRADELAASSSPDYEAACEHLKWCEQQAAKVLELWHGAEDQWKKTDLPNVKPILTYCQESEPKQFKKAYAMAVRALRDDAESLVLSHDYQESSKQLPALIERKKNLEEWETALIQWRDVWQEDLPILDQAMQDCLSLITWLKSLGKPGDNSLKLWKKLSKLRQWTIKTLEHESGWRQFEPLLEQLKDIALSGKERRAEAPDFEKHKQRWLEEDVPKLDDAVQKYSSKALELASDGKSIDLVGRLKKLPDYAEKNFKYEKAHWKMLELINELAAISKPKTGDGDYLKWEQKWRQDLPKFEAGIQEYSSFAWKLASGFESVLLVQRLKGVKARTAIYLDYENGHRQMTEVLDRLAEFGKYKGKEVQPAVFEEPDEPDEDETDERSPAQKEAGNKAHKVRATLDKLKDLKAGKIDLASLDPRILTALGFGKPPGARPNEDKAAKLGRPAAEALVGVHEVEPEQYQKNLQKQLQEFDGYLDTLAQQLDDMQALIDSGDPDLVAQAESTLDGMLSEGGGQQPKPEFSQVQTRIHELAAKLDPTIDDPTGAGLGRKVGQAIGTAGEGPDVIGIYMPQTKAQLQEELARAATEARTLPPEQALARLAEVEPLLAEAEKKAQAAKKEFEKLHSALEAEQRRFDKQKELTSTWLFNEAAEYNKEMKGLFERAEQVGKQEGGLPQGQAILEEIRANLDAVEKAADPREARLEEDADRVREKQEIEKLWRYWENALEGFANNELQQALQAIKKSRQQEAGLLGSAAAVFQDLKDLVSPPPLVADLQKMLENANRLVERYGGMFSANPAKRLLSDAVPSLAQAKPEFSAAHGMLAEARRAAAHIVANPEATGAVTVEDLKKLQQKWEQAASKYGVAVRKLGLEIKKFADKLDPNDPNDADLQQAAKRLGPRLQGLARACKPQAFDPIIGVLTDEKDSAKHKAAREKGLRLVRRLVRVLTKDPLAIKVRINPFDVKSLRPAASALRAVLKELAVNIEVAD